MKRWSAKDAARKYRKTRYLGASGAAWLKVRNVAPFVRSEFPKRSCWFISRGSNEFSRLGGRLRGRKYPLATGSREEPVLQLRLAKRPRKVGSTGTKE